VKRELALAVLPVALVLLGALYLACTVRSLGKPEILRELRELPELYATAVAEFVVTQVFLVTLMVSVAAGYITYVWLTVELDLPGEVAALASAGVAALSWLAQFQLAGYLLSLMLGCWALIG